MAPAPSAVVSPTNAEPISQAISAIVVRIGAVVVGIFLIQILVSFTRYQNRVAEHLVMCAQFVRLARSDAPQMRDLATALLPAALDFGMFDVSLPVLILERAPRPLQHPHGAAAARPLPGVAPASR
jgi:hypothetical protein